ncbi:chromate efflux transporter [Roseomonas sp. OT10]|uniref:chromate efflux transporter n=1 Tax=Roseomonas cutis TaxID=2897332 RepID=UPI001E2E5095|nr:chromate efflux transporter [Roseomonas sp. OT10]UFN50463.1 chromate efflux transporter [Roseomonas sp. OT10]
MPPPRPATPPSSPGDPPADDLWASHLPAGGRSPEGTVREVFRVFLLLGLTSFGGPVAHLGYFHAAFVERRRWLSEAAYAELVALCQFLPGPASSQVGFALGLLRAGMPGALAAWAGFTLPSATILVLFAAWAGPLAQSQAGAGLLHGLKLAAVAIVAQAVWGMARSLCPDRARAGIALAALAMAAAWTGPSGQLAAILLGGLAGLGLCRGEAGAAPAGALPVPLSRRAGLAWLLLFAALLLAGPLLPALGAAGRLFDAFYRAGALVFGGGHVVLPLLRDTLVLPGLVAGDAFLAGYGAAQAVPGPLFTVAAYLGAVAHPGPGGLAGAVLALTAIFLPGFLLLLGILPFWSGLRRRPAAQAALRGVNAAVVGLLGAALYDPVWTGAVLRPADAAVAAAGFLALAVWRAPALPVVGLCALAGLASALAP